MDDKIEGYHVREPWWTESLAVGDTDWIGAVAGGVTGGVRRIDRVISVYESGISEERKSYTLKTSKRERAAITRSL